MTDLQLVLHELALPSVRLRPAALGLGAASRFGGVPRMPAGLTLPSAESDAVDALGLTDDELDAFHDACETLTGGAAPELVPVHRMFGYPDEVQGSLDAGPAGGWELLLQLGTDDSLGLEFGDVGLLYFLGAA